MQHPGDDQGISDFHTKRPIFYGTCKANWGLPKLSLKAIVIATAVTVIADLCNRLMSQPSEPSAQIRAGVEQVFALAFGVEHILP